MNRTEKIQSIAARLKHNIEAKESIRKILSGKYDKGEQNSLSYKIYSEKFDKADNNVNNLRHELGELDARLTPSGSIEISNYKLKQQTQ